jgi:hypothetical protein
MGMCFCNIHLYACSMKINKIYEKKKENQRGHPCSLLSKWIVYIIDIVAILNRKIAQYIVRWALTMQVSNDDIGTYFVRCWYFYEEKLDSGAHHAHRSHGRERNWWHSHGSTTGKNRGSGRRPRAHGVGRWGGDQAGATKTDASTARHCAPLERGLGYWIRYSVPWIPNSGVRDGSPPGPYFISSPGSRSSYTIGSHSYLQDLKTRSKRMATLCHYPRALLATVVGPASRHVMPWTLTESWNSGWYWIAHGLSVISWRARRCLRWGSRVNRIVVWPVFGEEKNRSGLQVKPAVNRES